MSAVVFDVETSIFQKGNPFAKRNQLCYVGAYPEGGSILIGTPAILPHIERLIIPESTLVGFNLKFDLHWRRRAGADPSSVRRVWDCQLAHFLLTGQREVYPSLEGVCQYYGLSGKDPTIERDFWSKGIDTLDIPPELMLYYLSIDLLRTMEVYQKQREHFQEYPKLYRLFQVSCQDLLVLAEMEWNGLKLDVEKCQEESTKVHDELQQIETKLRGVYPHVPVNFDSPDHLSVFLYGGVIRVDRREVIGVYKSGQKLGKPRNKVIKDEFILPRMYQPIEKSELKKEGYYSTDETLIRQLRGPKGILELLLRRSELTKLLDYYEGLPELIEKMDWEPGMLHGQFNQVVAATGRLSASRPNQQNIAGDVKHIIVSRYNDA